MIKILYIQYIYRTFGIRIFTVYMLGVLAIHRCFGGLWMIYVKLSSFERKKNQHFVLACFFVHGTATDSSLEIETTKSTNSFHEIKISEK